MSVDPVEDADCYGDKLEKEEEEYCEQLDFQRSNWLEAVTNSPDMSLGNFKDKYYWLSGIKQELTPERIFLGTLCNNDFEQRVAKLLINGYTSGVVDITKVYKLFDDMATDYAESKV